MEGAVAACPVLPASTTATGGIAAAAAGATLSDAAGLDLGLQGPAAAIAATAASAFEAVCGRALTHLGDLAAGWGSDEAAPCISLMHGLIEQGQARGWQAVISQAAVLKEVCWERLHTGHWKEVPLAWRDAYCLFGVLHAAAGLLLFYEGRCSSAGTPDGPSQAVVCTASSAGRPAAGEAEAAVQRFSMRQLDLAAMMGGPTYRHLLDTCIHHLEQLLAPQQPPHEQQQQQQQQSLKRSRQEDVVHTGGPPAGAAGGANTAKRVCADLSGPALRLPPTEERHQGQVQEREQGLPAADAAAATAGAAAGGATDTPAAAAAPAGAQDLLPEAAHALLPPGSLAAPIQRVRVLHAPSLESFLVDVLLAPGGAVPVVVRGAMESWRALRHWGDMDYLLQVAGHRTVPVEVGGTYLEEGWGTAMMTLAEYIQLHVCGCPGDASSPGSGSHSSPATAAPQGGRPRLAYLAQHQLLEQVPALRRDICTPDYIALGEQGLDSVHAWFGPAGTVTPLHQDPQHNFLAQAVGCKYVRLFSPEDTPRLYPHDTGVHTNTSRVDVERVDEQAFPGFRSVPCWDVVLHPGDMLFMPARWWHFVKSLSVSFSVSFWWC